MRWPGQAGTRPKSKISAARAPCHTSVRDRFEGQHTRSNPPAREQELPRVPWVLAMHVKELCHAAR